MMKNSTKGEYGEERTVGFLVMTLIRSVDNKEGLAWNGPTPRLSVQAGNNSYRKCGQQWASWEKKLAPNSPPSEHVSANV